MPRKPKATHGDSYSLGQLATIWEKPATFVRGLVDRVPAAVTEENQ